MPTRKSPRANVSVQPELGFSGVWSAAARFSEDAPLIFGGDLNLRQAHDPEVFAELRERLELGDPTGPAAIDHLLARGLRVVDPPRRLAPAEREVTDPHGRLIRLSDHAPVVAEFVR